MSALAGISIVFFWIGTLRSVGEAAETPSGPQSPCDGFPCGPPEGAECEVLGSTFKCICKEGYRPSRDDQWASQSPCVPEGPCGKYPCGRNSERCLWIEDDKYRCKCKRGYTENKLLYPTCVHVYGDCEDHPCGFGGLCVAASDGGHTCDCDGGFERGPSANGETCKPTQKLTCESQPCGDESVGKCVETADSYFCVCREGSLPFYTAYDLPTCRALEDYNPCYEGACGEKGTSCVFVNNQRSCTCEEGFVPKPVNLWADQRCYMRGGEDSQEGSTSAPVGEGGNGGEDQKGNDNKKDSKVNSTVLVAGGVVGAVLLLSAIGGGLGYRHYKRKHGAVAREASIDFEDRDRAAAEDDESDVLINAKNEDWAH